MLLTLLLYILYENKSDFCLTQQ